MKLSGLFIFLLGFLVSLVFFVLVLPLFPNFQVTYKVGDSLTNWLTSVGTVLTGITAIALGLWKKSLNELFYKSDMKLIGHYENLQTYNERVTQGHTRLKISNEGKSPAEDVIAYINKIVDNGSPRQEFLPVPLPWTHDGRYIRNFATHEIWYLDLCLKGNIHDKIYPIFVLAAGKGVQNYEHIVVGQTILEVRLLHKSGQIRDYQIDLYWEPGKNYVEVQNIKEITT